MNAAFHAATLCHPPGPHRRTFFERWFPTPVFLARPGAGVDISDSSVKALVLGVFESGWRVTHFVDVPLAPGVVIEGVIKKPDELAHALVELSHRAGRFSYAHAALPEEAAFVFGMHVPDARDRAQVMNIIEFELEGRVPLKAAQAVFDYDIVALHSDGVGAEIGVTVFPLDVVEGYMEVFRRAHIELLSLELEARSIARAILPPRSNEVVLLADFGRARTGIAVLKGQIPIFTHTVPVGGDTMTAIIMKETGADEAKAEELKNEHGILKGGDEKILEAMVGTASALADEITQHYTYWDTRRNEHGERVTPVTRVILAGGSANLKGLSDYIASRVQAPTVRADVWRNVCDYSEYIPPIDKQHSLGYATAVGLALRGI